jgi:two-component system OmpR family sensor kinase
MNPRRALTAVRTTTAALPLRIKLVVMVLALAAIGLGGAGIATTESLHGYLINQVDNQLRTFSVAAAHRDFDGNVNVHPDFGPGPGGPVDTSGRQPQLPSQFYVAQFDPSGRRDGLYTAPLTSQSPPQLPVLTMDRATSLSDHAFTVRSQNGQSSWRVMTVVHPDGSGTVAVATSLSDVDHTVNHVIVLEVAIGAVLLALMGLGGYVVVNRSLRPLVTVEHTAAAIAAGDLTRRVPELPPRTEVGQLSLALNGMLAQIEDAFAHERDSQQRATASEERMRQFVADASHELRTPLTSIRGFAELYRMGAAEEADDLPRLMQRIENEAARMGVLVQDLLLLARLDQQRPLEREPVDLLAAVTDVVHDARLTATDRTVTLEVAATEPPVVTGDESRLRQVLHNLMTNALTHTPGGTPVDVTVRTEEQPRPSVVIEIADRGPGIGNEHTTRVFERFYRADTSRSRDTGGGTGLGLSIVAGLVAAHDGTVAVSDRAGGGAVFAVTLPLAGSAAVMDTD